MTRGRCHGRLRWAGHHRGCPGLLRRGCHRGDLHL